MTTTNQVKRVPNPTGKGGFGERPQDRNPGRWDSKNSVSYQYNRFLHMSHVEFESWKPQDDTSTVEVLAYNRVQEAKASLPDLKEITDRIEGRPFQAMDITSDNERLGFGISPEQADQLIRARANRSDT